VGPVTPAVEEWIGERFRQQPDVRLREFQQQVGQAQGLRLSIGVLWLVLRQMGTRLKKSLHAQEQDTPEAQRRRQAWRKAISGPDPAQLVFLDEIGASIYIRQNYGRAPIERPLA
jgi:C4-type Zn-finger protein